MAAEEDQQAVFEWNFENTTEPITLYEKFSCLYHLRSKDYKNRDGRNKVVAEIAVKGRNIHAKEKQTRILKKTNSCIR